MKFNLKWINTGAFAATVLINALANLIPFGGNTTAQVSEAYPNLFTPAPITFIIWGLIYLLMAVFIVYQWEVFDGGQYSAKVREEIGPWFAFSCAANIAWVFLWHSHLIGLSTVCIVLLLFSLVMIRRCLSAAGHSLLQRLSTKVGFSVYFGWIIAATIANISVLLTKLGWNGWGLSGDFWTVAVLLIGAGIAAAVVLVKRDNIAGLTVMWAFAGVLIRHISPAYLGGAHPFVIAAGFASEAIILMTILMPLAMLTFGRCPKQKRVSVRIGGK